MCSTKKYLKKTLVFNSADRITGTSNNYQVKFGDRLQIVKSISLLGVQLPNSIYNIDSTNNTLVINDGVGDYIIQLGPGSYTKSTLIAPLVAALTAAYANTWAVVFDSLTLKTTISGAAGFSIVGSLSTLHSVLGFAATDTAIATSHISPSAYNLGVPSPVYININEVGSEVMCSDGRNYTFVMPITENSEEFVNYFRMTMWKQYDSFDIHGLQFVNVSLRRRNNQLLDLNGLDWSMVVEVEYEM